MAQTNSGIWPVLPTPFLDNGQVDPRAMRRLVQFALRAGVGGVVFPGFASEVETLTAAERASLLAVVAKEAWGMALVVAGASSDTVAEVVAHGSAANRLGIRHLMIQPPKRLGSDAGPAIEFLTAVAAELPDSGIILQNAPAPRGADLSPQAILEITQQVRQVVYVKEETLPAGPAISHILANRPTHLLGIIGGGGARYILDEYARGACAAMPAIEIADLHVALDAAWRAGRFDEAREIYVRTLPLLTLQAVYRMRLTKHVMMRRGILDNAQVRAPTPMLDATAIADIDANLDALGLIDSHAMRGVGGE